MLWVFGYGSLVWKPDFDHAGCQPATLSGYARRFCQASHDHRGTPENPGRVVTLIACPGSHCRGMAYRIPQSGRQAILDYLDHREQDGYERVEVELQLDDGSRVDGLVWMATESNPSWRGGESLDQVASLIAMREGPSGSNRDYLYRLEESLTRLGMDDEHVSELCRRVRHQAGAS